MDFHLKQGPHWWVFSTHGHAINSLCLYLWRKRKSLYSTEFTIELLNFVKSNDSVKKFNTLTSRSEFEIDFGDANVSLLKQTHSSLKVSGLICTLRVISSTQETLNLTKLPASCGRQTLACLAGRLTKCVLPS